MQEQKNGDAQSKKYPDFRESVKEPATQMVSEKVDIMVTPFLNKDTIVAKYQPQKRNRKR